MHCTGESRFLARLASQCAASDFARNDKVLCSPTTRGLGYGTQYSQPSYLFPTSRFSGRKYSAGISAKMKNEA